MRCEIRRWTQWRSDRKPSMGFRLGPWPSNLNDPELSYFKVITVTVKYFDNDVWNATVLGRYTFHTYFLRSIKTLTWFSWLTPCRSQWSTGRRRWPLVFIQFCLILSPASTFLSLDLFPTYSLAALFLCGLALPTVVFAWLCCHHFLFLLTCVTAIKLIYFHVEEQLDRQGPERWRSWQGSAESAARDNTHTEKKKEMAQALMCRIALHDGIRFS